MKTCRKTVKVTVQLKTPPAYGPNATKSNGGGGGNQCKSSGGNGKCGGK